MPDLNAYQRHARYDAANGVWLGTIDEFPEIETAGASATIAIGLLDNALLNLIEQYQQEGWTVPMPEATQAGLLSPGAIVAILAGLLFVVVIFVLAARCGWMPAGW